MLPRQQKKRGYMFEILVGFKSRCSKMDYRTLLNSVIKLESEPSMNVSNHAAVVGVHVKKVS